LGFYAHAKEIQQGEDSCVFAFQEMVLEEMSTNWEQMSLSFYLTLCKTKGKAKTETYKSTGEVLAALQKAEAGFPS
jgi:hypothetical protein